MTSDPNVNRSVQQLKKWIDATRKSFEVFKCHYLIDIFWSVKGSKLTLTDVSQNFVFVIYWMNGGPIAKVSSANESIPRAQKIIRPKDRIFWIWQI